MLWLTFFLAGRYLGFYEKPINQQIIIGSMCVVACVVVYVFGFEKYYSLRSRFAPRGYGWPVEKSRAKAATHSKRTSRDRLLIFSLSAVIVISGWILLRGASAAAMFAGAFMCVTGAQIFLWLLGLRLEILSTAPSVVDMPKISGKSSDESAERADALE